jgi:hypothetical protein
MKSPAFKSGFLLLARSTSSSDWLNCCERSLAGGESVFVAKLRQASSWYLPKLPMTGRSLARLARKSQKNDARLRFVLPAAICSDGLTCKPPKSERPRISEDFRNLQNANFWHVRFCAACAVEWTISPWLPSNCDL